MREFRDYFLLVNEIFVLETINVSSNVQHIPTPFLQNLFSYSPTDTLPHFSPCFLCLKLLIFFITYLSPALFPNIPELLKYDTHTQFLYMTVLLESAVDS